MMENKQPTLVLPNINAIFSSFSEDEMEVGRIINSFPATKTSQPQNQKLILTSPSTSSGNPSSSSSSSPQKTSNFDFKTYDIANPLFPVESLIFKPPQQQQQTSNSLSKYDEDEEIHKAILCLKRSPGKTKRIEEEEQQFSSPSSFLSTTGQFYSPKKLKLANHQSTSTLSASNDYQILKSPLVLSSSSSPSASPCSSILSSPSASPSSESANIKLPSLSSLQSSPPSSNTTSLLFKETSNISTPLGSGNRDSTQLDSTLLNRLLHGALYHNNNNNGNNSSNNNTNEHHITHSSSSSSFSPSSSPTLLIPHSSPDRSNFDNGDNTVTHNNNNNNNNGERSNNNNGNNSNNTSTSTTVATTVPSMDYLTKMIASKGGSSSSSSSSPLVSDKLEVKYLLKMFKRINGNQPWIESSIAPPMIGKMRKITIELEDLYKPLQLNVNISKIKTKGNQSCLVVSENNKVYKKNQKIEGSETYSTIFYPFKGKQFKNLFLKPCWICFGPRKDRPVFRVVISVSDIESGFSKVLHCWNTEVHCHKMESSLKGKLLDNFNNPTFIRNSFSL